MCYCTPEIRTPQCHRIGCVPSVPVTVSNNTTITGIGEVVQNTANALRKFKSAVDTMKSLGFTWHGGEYWKPPLGNAPSILEGTKKETIHQYYYKKKGCDSSSSRGTGCICWYDKGTGPFKHAENGEHTTFRWRIKPFQSDIVDDGTEHF